MRPERLLFDRIVRISGLVLLLVGFLLFNKEGLGRPLINSLLTVVCVGGFQMFSSGRSSTPIVEDDEEVYRRLRSQEIEADIVQLQKVIRMMELELKRSHLEREISELERRQREEYPRP